MKKQLVATLFLVIAPLFFVSCVSSLLKEKAPTFSREVKFNIPASPFVALQRSIYPSWKSKTTGNVISIFSDCQANSVTTLSELQRYIEDSIENSKLISETTTPFDKKSALTRVLQGELENNPIQIKSIAFKRLSCGYVVSLSGKPDQVAKDEPSLELFLKSLTFK